LKTIIPLLLTLVLSVATTSPDPTQPNHPLAALLPQDGALPGWNRAESPTYYGPHNLWDHINGAAALYLDYGFTSLATAYYKTTDGKSTAALEIYRMETPLHAFAIYAAERSPEDEFIRIGAEGYLSDNTLNFWKGPYYAKLSSYRTREDPKGILKALAGTVASQIPGRYTEPEAFGHFPAKNRVAKSERYIPKNFLGHPFFKAGYRVNYQGDRGNYQLFLVPTTSPAEAEAAFTRYRKHLVSQNTGLISDKKPEYQTMSTTDGKMVFLYKSFVGGVLGETDQPTACKLIEAMVNALRKISP